MYIFSTITLLYSICLLSSTFRKRIKKYNCMNKNKNYYINILNNIIQNDCITEKLNDSEELEESENLEESYNSEKEWEIL